MSKGNQIMQKIVIKKPWGVEIKDYKAGDPIPAGVKFKIFDAKDTAKIEEYADSLDESADYQKKRFKEPYYMYEEWGKASKPEAESKKQYLKYVDDFEKDIKKYIDWMRKDIKAGNSINLPEVCISLSTALVNALTRYNNAVKTKTLTESFIITDSINGKPTYLHYGKFTGYDWWYEKEKATKFPTKEAADKMIEKMRQDGAIVKDMKVIEEGRIARGYENLDADEKARHLLSHPSSKYMSDLKSENITERAIRKAVKEMLGKPDKDDPQFITDVNEASDAEIEKAKQSVEFWKKQFKKNGGRGMTGAALRDAEERLRKLQHGITEEGEAPAVATTTANVANPELPLKLREEDVEDSYKYQTSVAGGMGTDAENAESAQEHDDEVVLVREHKSFRKFLKESH